LYYFIGIKGIGMSALAQVLSTLGYSVQGCDDGQYVFTEDELKKHDIKIHDFGEISITNQMIVVKGENFNEQHSEVVRAKDSGARIVTYQALLSKLTRIFDTYAVTGCQGKTTTTSMLSHVFDAVKGCNYLLGDGRGYASKYNDIFVIEASENQRDFLTYLPEYTIITSIDYDYVDYYKDIDDVIDAYQSFCNITKKTILACGDDPNTRKIKTNKRIFYYGLGEENEITAKNISFKPTGVSFDVFVEDNFYGKFDLPFYGKHMILNTLAVIGIAYYERVEVKLLSKILKTFKSSNTIKEETIGKTVLIEHYVSHPNEIETIILATRHKYPEKKITTILQTQKYSKTKALLSKFVENLSLSDNVYLMEYAIETNELKEETVASRLILDTISNSQFLEDVADIKKHKDEVIILMSNKNINPIKDKIKEQLV
jgi:UDP-N-acetylmuramate--alanine ligase